VVEPALQSSPQRRPDVTVTRELVVAARQPIEHVGADVRVGLAGGVVVGGGRRACEHRVDRGRQRVAGAGIAVLAHHIALVGALALVQDDRERLETRPVLQVAFVERVWEGVGGKRSDLRDDNRARRHRLGHDLVSMRRWGAQHFGEGVTSSKGCLDRSQDEGRQKSYPMGKARHIPNHTRTTGNYTGHL
jgi:hypothetical protein